MRVGFVSGATNASDWRKVMASDLVVPVVRLEDVRPHPNADRLDLCTVLGYQVVVPRGEYANGDVAIYFPADTIIPDVWVEQFGIHGYLHGADKNRVGRIRLRGEPSFGLVVGLPEGKSLPDNVGDNLAEFFECEKYEPPIRATAGDAAAHDPDVDPLLAKFTDIQNGRIFTDVFVDGEPVVATEKIHGTCCTVGLTDGGFFAASKNYRRTRPVEQKTGEGAALDSNLVKASTYWSPLSNNNVVRMLEHLKSMFNAKAVSLYGEVFGSSIQSLHYGLKGKLGFRAFDIMVDGKYLDFNFFLDVCVEFEVFTAPILYSGPFLRDAILPLADGQSVVDGSDHIREGIVVRPVVERTDPKVGRVILKYIGTEYELSKHKAKDTTDS